MRFRLSLLIFITYMVLNLANKTHESYLRNSSSNVLTPDEDTSKEKLEDILGPRKKGLVFVACMSTVYILILLCGLIGNISTCFVVIYNNCMHTTTNYYLFSLAVSDVLFLLTGLPPELYSIIIEAYPWAFGETFCIIRTFIFETTTIASVLTILTFTFERWLHICKAIYAKKFSSGFSRALKIILFIWILSGLLALPYAFMTGVYLEEENNPVSKTCNIPKEYKHYMKNVIQLSVIFLFIIPMTLISIMYVLIGVTLWKSQSRHKAGSYTSYQFSYTQKEKKFTRKFNQKFGKKDKKISFDSKFENCKNLVQDNLAINDTLLSKNNSEFNVGDMRKVSLNAYERPSKEFEHISYRARQSRRDVVKMLCKFKFNIFLFF